MKQWDVNSFVARIQTNASHCPDTLESHEVISSWQLGYLLSGKL